MTDIGQPSILSLRATTAIGTRIGYIATRMATKSTIIERSMQMADQPHEGDLKFWWIPQIPGKAFEVPIATIAEGRKLEQIFADYDLFQLEQHVKPDYSNTGGISRWERNGDDDGFDWYDVDEEEEDTPLQTDLMCVCCEAGTGRVLCDHCWTHCIRSGDLQKHIP